ncbi:hypothetical protein BKA93DRAFT_32127 [Sparassis latifolia]
MCVSASSKTKMDDGDNTRPLSHSRSRRLRSHDKQDSSRPTKRIRLDPPRVKHDEYTRHGVYWYTSGSVILRVSNTLFKLSKMRLASQSQYFAKLFEQENAHGGSSSQGSEEVFTREVVDGCPVYEVLNLSVLDMERLLGALDDGLALSVVPPSFEVIVSILRAASRLSISSAIAYAKHQLRKAWPSDLDKLNCGGTDLNRVTQFIFPGGLAPLYNAGVARVLQLQITREWRRRMKSLSPG